MRGLDEAFRYNTWANLAVLDYCSALPEDTLEMSHPGTFGTIMETFIHMVEQERWGLAALGKRGPKVGEINWESLRSALETDGALWLEVVDEMDDLLAQDLPPKDFWDAPIPEFPIMYALQTLHHQELHRTQIHTTLGSAGQLPEEKDSSDVWAYWIARGLLK